MNSPSASPALQWRSLVLPAFAPALLFALGEGAILPIIPLAAEHLGASLPVAGLVASLVVVGTLIGDLPSGLLVSRIGERRAMLAAGAVALGGLVACVLAHTVLVLGVGVLLVGIATAVFALARQAFLTAVVPASHRARALSTLGGAFRAGYFFGPFISAGVIIWTGTTMSAFWIDLVACALVSVLLLVVPDPTDALLRSTAEPAGTSPVAVVGAGLPGAAAERPVGLVSTIRRNARVLLQIGTGTALLQTMRSSRQVTLPLAAIAIGLHDAQTALIIGIAGGVDFALFYTSGAIMDRFGRMWSVLPSMIGLSLTHIALAFVFMVPDPVAWFVGIALVMSVANGVGSGIVMTLGSDLAGRRNPAAFLGAWRFTGDAGQAVAPLIIAGVTAVASLPVASVVIAVLGAGGAVSLVKLLPKYTAVPLRRAVRPAA